MANYSHLFPVTCYATRWALAAFLSYSITTDSSLPFVPSVCVRYAEHLKCLNLIFSLQPFHCFFWPRLRCRGVFSNRPRSNPAELENPHFPPRVVISEKSSCALFSFALWKSLLPASTPTTDSQKQKWRAKIGCAPFERNRSRRTAVGVKPLFTRV